MENVEKLLFKSRQPFYHRNEPTSTSNPPNYHLLGGLFSYDDKRVWLSARFIYLYSLYFCWLVSYLPTIHTIKRLNSIFFQAHKLHKRNRCRVRVYLYFLMYYDIGEKMSSFFIYNCSRFFFPYTFFHIYLVFCRESIFIHFSTISRYLPNTTTGTFLHHYRPI